MPKSDQVVQPGAVFYERPELTFQRVVKSQNLELCDWHGYRGNELLNEYYYSYCPDHTKPSDIQYFGHTCTGILEPQAPVRQGLTGILGISTRQTPLFIGRLHIVAKDHGKFKWQMSVFGREKMDRLTSFLDALIDAYSHVSLNERDANMFKSRERTVTLESQRPYVELKKGYTPSWSEGPGI